MDIGLVCPYDYSYPGGVSSHVSYLAYYFLLMGHQVKIVAPCSKNGVSYFGEDVIRVGKPFPMPSNKSIARIPISPWLPVQVKRVLSQESFDILHIHEPFCPMLSFSVLMESHFVNVGTFHAYYSKPRAYWLCQPIFRRLLAKLQGKIAISQAARECVSRYLPGNYQVIPIGIDTDFFSPQVPPVEKFADGKVNILFVGRLERRKGLDCLLAAYGKVKKEFPDLRLIIVGTGAKLPKYKTMVEEDKLTNVVFAGFVPRKDLPRYYSSADICCFPATNSESFGTVLLEAMASGKPVIASNVGGYNEVLSHGEEGLIIPSKDEEALAQALLLLAQNKPLRQQMGAKGRNKAEKYSWKNVAQRVMDYYVTLLNKRDKVR